MQHVSFSSLVLNQCVLTCVSNTYCQLQCNFFFCSRSVVFTKTLTEQYFCNGDRRRFIAQLQLFALCQPFANQRKCAFFFDRKTIVEDIVRCNYIAMLVIECFRSVFIFCLHQLLAVLGNCFLFCITFLYYCASKRTMELLDSRR